MARKVMVFVHDEKGYGKSGIKVKLYTGENGRTDKHGKISFIVETTNMTLYVDGKTAYDGAVSRAPDIIEWEIS